MTSEIIQCVITRQCCLAQIVVHDLYFVQLTCLTLDLLGKRLNSLKTIADLAKKVGHSHF